MSSVVMILGMLLKDNEDIEKKKERSFVRHEYGRKEY